MLEHIYHTIMGRTKLPRTLESNSRDPLSAAKPYMYVCIYIYILFLAMMIMMKMMMMMMMVVMMMIYPILDYIWTLYNIH